MNQSELLLLVLERINELKDQMGDISGVQMSQHEVLKEHIRRTEAAEKSLEVLTKEMKPVLTHVGNMQFIGRFLLLLLGSGGVIFLTLKTVFLP